MPLTPSVSQTVLFGFSGQLLEVAATASLSIGTFVYASGSFALVSGGDIYVTPAGATSTVQVSLLEVGGHGAQVRRGRRGRTRAAPAVPVLLTGDLGLALMTQVGGGATYYALQAGGIAQVLLGTKGISLFGSVEVSVNHASSGSAIDFTQMAGGELAIPTGPGPNPTTVDLAFSGPILQVSGSLTLQIDNFVSVSGSFAFTQGGTISVTSVGGGTAPANLLEVGVLRVRLLRPGANDPTATTRSGSRSATTPRARTAQQRDAPIDGDGFRGPAGERQRPTSADHGSHRLDAERQGSTSTRAGRSGNPRRPGAVTRSLSRPGRARACS